MTKRAKNIIILYFSIYLYFNFIYNICTYSGFFIKASEGFSFFTIIVFVAINPIILVLLFLEKSLNLKIFILFVSFSWIVISYGYISSLPNPNNTPDSVYEYLGFKFIFSLHYIIFIKFIIVPFVNYLDKIFTIKKEQNIKNIEVQITNEYKKQLDKGE
ncbi:putative membrane protein [Campylobacter blaseri]|uniref:Uncharacterized protein n=1 Tax=Campylobacter blaseri TaxID=2042961 RepID=A0A2P8QZF1_9BACT|nr:hypothetical protein [Campylobacter blaseri]PSM51620.1 hypothetical protein CQ405_07440 [Campylobacter blaseri]PSM53413.1 hypothetical protein CRN67_07445 [Campylobacter blaseri]QKF86710.1 putative membrane protein [Campylobacter blaseri]